MSSRPGLMDGSIDLRDEEQPVTVALLEAISLAVQFRELDRVPQRLLYRALAGAAQMLTESAARARAVAAAAETLTQPLAGSLIGQRARAQDPPCPT